MITQENETLKSTAESIYESNADWVTIEKCRAREDAIIHEQYMTNRIKELEEENATLYAKIADLESKLQK